MGDVKEILASVNTKEQPHFRDDLRIEVSEAIHLHWRDCRILMTPKQFVNFGGAVVKAGTGWSGRLAEEDTVLCLTKITEDTIFKQQWKIEEQENGSIHFHYGDIRLELKMSEFIKMACMFKDSLSVKLRETMLPLASVNPYDHIHFPTKEGWLGLEGYSQEHLEADYKEHQAGVEWMKSKIEQGYQIEPILVTKKDSDIFFQRRDGYKRYMAYEAMKKKLIPVYVVSEAIALTCPQDKQYPFRTEDHIKNLTG